MSELKKHWTERSIDDFLYRIGADFVRQLEAVMARRGETRVALADRLGVSKGRISQLLNNPGNLTLRKSIEYARALGLKVSLVPYDDGDTANANGPVNAEIFTTCWQMAGMPTDFFALRNVAKQQFVSRQGSQSQVGANEHYNVWLTNIAPHDMAGTPPSIQVGNLPPA
jgi:transcriptional regulator with XRE-family HTH domain